MSLNNILLQTHKLPKCIWFTGLSGAGKSSLANLLAVRLKEKEMFTYVLDGDVLRRGLNRDLDFTEASRAESVRRASEVARLMYDAGLTVITSLISPIQSDRLAARNLFNEGDFIEVYLSTPLSICEARDIKGLYAQARNGHIKHFTGIDSPYQPPENPELILDTSSSSIDECVDKIIDYLNKN
jgi:adenylyl-sulfate kinase